MKTDPLTRRRKVLKELRTIPGIGPSLALDLYDLGIRRISDLRHRDPERMYRRLEHQTGAKQDRCVLYVFRCAVYFAKTKHPRPERLLWWNWQDKPRGASASSAARSASAPRKPRRPRRSKG